MQRATLLVATQADVLVVDAERGEARQAEGLDGVTPICLAADPRDGRVWCGSRSGVFQSEDGGRSWRPSGLPGRRVTAMVASPTVPDLLWAGTEPSELWRSSDGGVTWFRTAPLDTLPSSRHWAFPPRPSTHHVRWIACDPTDGGALWVAIEAGALIRTRDGGETWEDRVAGGPIDTHELAVHPHAPRLLRSAAGDGYFESPDGGASWSKPEAGLAVGYLRSVAVDPGDPSVAVVSAATGPRSAYNAHQADGRVYRREGHAPWQHVTRGWPVRPSNIAPILRPGLDPGELWATDERGVHTSEDGGASWERVAGFAAPPLRVHDLVMLG
ncbi:MAG TPA: hypothetical protein VFQ22_08235, partial [Longimicrobiales bacterium]|nr:hypothetical protein [Longimicrobiales bacterium]